VDEAGRGPWAGPVVAAAVILRTKRLPVRIDDSKRLSPRQRDHAYHVILERADVGVGIACADEIDQDNILHASLRAMAQAVFDLRTTPDLVLVDGQIAIPRLAMPCRPIVHGDQRIYVIACASIVAKVVRDRLMVFYSRLYPAYRFHEHKGYGTERHAGALAVCGPSFLHRLSFEPVQACVSAREGASS